MKAWSPKHWAAIEEVTCELRSFVFWLHWVFVTVSGLLVEVLRLQSARSQYHNINFIHTAASFCTLRCWPLSVTGAIWETSLVVQWLGIHLPVQGTRVRFLVQGDHTWPGATKPKSHNCLEPLLCNKRSHLSEKPSHHKEDPAQLKMNK